MPLTISLNGTGEKIFVIGTDASGLEGAPLGTGQTIAVVSADPTIVDFTPDAAPAADNEGVQSIYSAALKLSKVGGPVNCTATVSNADGSVAETAVDTVTVTPAVAGPAVKIGELFEAVKTSASGFKGKG